MSLNRYAAKRDIAESAIVAALKSVGAQVFPLDWPADLLVRFRREWHVLEVKTGTAKTRKTQAAQANFIASTDTPVVRNPTEALRAIGAI